jgi:hypothetical protein
MGSQYEPGSEALAQLSLGSFEPDSKLSSHDDKVIITSKDAGKKFSAESSMVGSSCIRSRLFNSKDHLLYHIEECYRISLTTVRNALGITVAAYRSPPYSPRQLR